MKIEKLDQIVPKLQKGPHFFQALHPHTKTKKMSFAKLNPVQWWQQTHARIHAHAHTHTHAHTYTHTRTNAYTHTRTRAHAHTHTHTHARTHAQISLETHF